MSVNKESKIDLILQSNSFNIIWDAIIISSVTFIVLLLPLHLIFNLWSKNAFVTASWIFALLFTIDMFVNIGQSRANNKLMFEDTHALTHYFKYWFIFDLIAAIPFGLLLNSSLLGLLWLAKLGKVGKIMYLYRHRHLRYSSLLLLSYFVVGIAFASHWITCGWLAINGINPDASRITNYINSFYWSVTTLTTVGYGDIIPKNNAQKLYAVLTMILGISFFGYLIGNIASILSKKDPADMHFLENIEKLSISVKYRSIPPDLQKRIYDYYTYIWKKRLGYDESSFLNSLPKSLKTEVSLYLRREVIKKILLFRNTDQKFIKEIALQLKPVILTPGDYVFKAGDEGKEMYFVVHGELDVFLKDEKKPLARLSDGDFFGEIALFMKKPRTATIKAVTYCDLYTLGKNTFNHLVSKYPDIAAEIEKKAKTREEKNVMLWER